MRVVGLAGWSGSGKTTLVAKLIPRITARGLRVSTLKHAHAGFDVDVPGKDSHTHRLAGATEVLISSPRRFALMHELRGATEMELPELLQKLSPVDLVIVEGYKRYIHPKLEIFRAEVGKEFLYPTDPNIFAVASDQKISNLSKPQYDLNDIEALVTVMLVNAKPLQEVLANTTSSENA
jgi:molybdopterin-guanine dinucleotide biosynthesis protein B